MSFRYFEIGVGIYNENPGKYYEYGCILVANRGDKMVKEIMGQAIFIDSTTVRIDGNRAYTFVIGSYIWYMFVSSHIKNSNLTDSFLSENGVLIAFRHDKNVEKFLRKICQRLKARNR